MKVLLVGNGAREHAIAEAICRSAKKPELYSYATAMNPGIAGLAKSTEIGKMEDVERIAGFGKRCRAGLAVIGPELPLEKGVADALEKAGIPCVGPGKSAARIETDKSFARNLMMEHGIDGVVEFCVFDDADEVADFIDSYGQPVVVKPVGLTGGKGVKIVDPGLEGQLKDNEEAKRYAREVIGNRIGGQAKVLIEEKVEGEEFSLQAFVDGRVAVPMPLVQDHKFAFEGDTGPFTGGMGSISDSNHLLPFVTKEDCKQAVRIMQDVVQAMKKEGMDYRGILYGGFMATRNGPKIMEFNARFGDPEAMNVLPLLETDFLGICEAITSGNLTKNKIRFSNKAAVCKYVVPEGYPTSPVKGKAIEIGNPGDARIYYASVDQQDSLIMTGSRAIGCVGLAGSIQAAEEIAERAAQAVSGPVFHRADIGTEALLRKRVEHMQRLRGQK